MSLISEKFADELTDKEMRDLFRAAQTRTKVVSQIRAIRKQRGWSQAEFARQLGKPQSNVSQRLENREYGGFTLATLLDIAATFDVGLVVEFVPYDEFIRRTNDLTDSALGVPGFDRGRLAALCNDADDKSGNAAKQPAHIDVGETPWAADWRESGNALVGMHSNIGQIHTLVSTLKNWYAQASRAALAARNVGYVPLVPTNTAAEAGAVGELLSRQQAPLSIIEQKDKEIAYLKRELSRVESELSRANEKLNYRDEEYSRLLKAHQTLISNARSPWQDLLIPEGGPGSGGFAQWAINDPMLVSQPGTLNANYQRVGVVS